MKIFCIGRNYGEHIKELNNDVPDEPVIFMKPKNALMQMHVPFFYPEFTNELHYEAELVLKVCKNGKYISKQQALKFVDSITVGIDFTARDLQNRLKEKRLPWEKAKAWDNSAVVGKWTNISPGELEKPIHFSMKKNDEVVQKGTSSEMIFSFAEIISNVSQYFSLNIGDLIFTGTPAGVGECVVGDKLEGFYGDESVFQMTIS